MRARHQWLKGLLWRLSADGTQSLKLRQPHDSQIVRKVCKTLSSSTFMSFTEVPAGDEPCGEVDHGVALWTHLILAWGGLFARAMLSQRS
eukprot:3405354-Amphidinium_carterae.2